MVVLLCLSLEKKLALSLCNDSLLFPAVLAEKLGELIGVGCCSCSSKASHMHWLVPFLSTFMNDCLAA